IIGDRGLSCYLDKDNYYVENTLICCLLKRDLKDKFKFNKEECELSKKYKLLFLLAILNSKLVTYYFKTKLGDKLQIYNRAVELLPIKSVNFADKKQKFLHNEISNMVDKWLKLNRQIQNIPENSDKWHKLKKEIGNLDNTIDVEV
ncbi:unnamed protein product, partial [marine sediment metagenome]